MSKLVELLYKHKEKPHVNVKCEKCNNRNLCKKHDVYGKNCIKLKDNGRPLADVRDLNTALVNMLMSPAYWQAVVGRSYSLWMF